MRVDFYQLSRDPVEQVLPAIAQRLIEEGERLLVVDAREGALPRLSRALWEWRPESFIAHGQTGEGDESLQPVLLSTEPQPASGARNIALADGAWRDDALDYERAFYFFDQATIADARECWKKLKGTEGVDPRFWRQEGGRWIEGP